MFPAAVDRDILMAIGPSSRKDGTIKIENLDANYEAREFKAERQPSKEWSLPIDTSKLSWESYVKAGYWGILEQFFQHEGTPQAFDLLVTGSVPAGSGLSSSAAMVVASSLSFLVMNNRLEGLTKRALVEMAMKNERRVGVNSGGMDQAASVISDSNNALYITFHPTLEAEPIPIPASANPAFNPVFVIANSLVVSDKAVSAKTQYNLRVLETLAAARILARKLNLPINKTEKVTLKEVLDHWTNTDVNNPPDPAQFQSNLTRILGKLDVLKGPEDETVTMEQMVNASGLTATEFHDLYLSWNEVEATNFELFKRAKHVYSEALRVLRFRETCLHQSSDNSSSDKLLQDLGALMNESQESCAHLFNCSCPELDTLTQLARSAGAYGSRLTGAGWGGCSVSLISEANVEKFITALQQNFGPYKDLHGEALHQVIFAMKPGSGACVYTVS